MLGPHNIKIISGVNLKLNSRGATMFLPEQLNHRVRPFGSGQVHASAKGAGASRLGKVSFGRSADLISAAHLDTSAGPRRLRGRPLGRLSFERAPLLDIRRHWTDAPSAA